MATISDVARLAEVSVTTVSHALNGTRPVSAERRRRVLAAAEALDYQPDAAARMLRTGRSHTLALLVPDITNSWHPLVARGLLDVTVPEGYHTLLCVTDGRVEQEEAFLTDLARRRVDGIMIITFYCQMKMIQRAVRGIPTVLSGPPGAPLDPFDRVIFDEVHAGRLAVEHLIDRGCRRIAAISGPADNPGSQRRIHGYREALEARGLPANPQLVEEGDYWLPSGARATERLLALRPRPDAIFAANDLMALGALSTLRQAGIAVPEDVALVGFDDIPEAEIAYPQLTTVRQPAYEIGRLAGRGLLERLAGPRDERPAEPGRELGRLEPVLIRRGTA